MFNLALLSRLDTLQPQTIMEERLIEECKVLVKALADCYRETGADPDYNEDWRLASGAVYEVKRLREELDCQYAGEDW